MDAFTFIIGLTLAIAGVFLYRDYASFLRGTYAKYGRVVSIQQVFSTPMSVDAETDPSAKSFVTNGFYPVIEYPNEGGKVRFTAIDQQASGNFHVGDPVKLRIIKTRRQCNRTCKSFIALAAMITLLALSMLFAALTSSFSISVSQVLLASLVITASLSILILYIRDQDQHYLHEISHTRGGRTQLFLCEPTAFGKWKSALRDPVQRYRIRSTQFFGATFIGSSAVMLAVALQPWAQFIIFIQP